MNKQTINQILPYLKATRIHKVEIVQNLWSNFGQIMRIHSDSQLNPSAIIKYIQPPTEMSHPTGWNSEMSRARKVKSYEMEKNFYEQHSNTCNDKLACRVPHHIFSIKKESEIILILEDLGISGFEQKKENINIEEAKLCISWLAKFHAIFLNTEVNNLWTNGTYWHLDTRQDELKVMNEHPLRKHAHVIDEKLKNSKYKTFVHGDAKVANFCFSSDNANVAAVDFQYVGGGCGMKDLAYFIGSVFNSHDCEKYEQLVLVYYFSELNKALLRLRKPIDLKELEANWRSLYSFAWADFHRFLLGWRPGHWKLHKYGEKMVDSVINQIEHPFK